MALKAMLTLSSPPDQNEGSSGGTTTFTWTVTRTGDTSGASSATWTLTGTAANATDLAAGQALTGTVSFTAGQTSRPIAIGVKADTATEPDETLTLTLTAPVGCVLIQQQPNGSYQVNTDESVLFTPVDGSGGLTVSSVYEVKNSAGALRTANINVNITSGGPPTWPNLYEQKAELNVTARSATMNGFIVLLDYTDPRLRHTTSGGVVKSLSGFDIRLEDGAGNALRYRRILYTPTSGRLLALVERTLGTSATNIELYAGRAGVADQQNLNTLDGYLGYWRMDTGADLSPNARNLTLTGVAAGTLFGCPAGVGDGVASVAELADPSAWLNGITSYCYSFDLSSAQITVDAGFHRVGGVATSADTAVESGTRTDAVTFQATVPAHRVFTFTDEITIAAVDTDCRVEGQDETLLLNTPQCVTRTWTSGQAQTLITDATVNVPSYADVATPTGALSSDVGPLAFFAGPRAFWAGTLGLCRFRSTRPSNAFILAEHENRRTPLVFMSKGALSGPTEAAPAAAFPSTASVAPGASTVLLPLANDTGATIKVISASTTQGTVSINGAGTQLNFTAPAAYVGPAYVTYTIRDSLLRTSTSVIVVSTSTLAELAATFIHVYEMETDNIPPGKTLVRPAFTNRGTSDANQNRSSRWGPLANKVVDLRERVGEMHFAGADKNFNTAFAINAAEATTTFCGGATRETNSAYINGTWSNTHGEDPTGENSPGMKVDQAPLGVKFQGFYFRDAMDGFIPGATLPDSANPIFENVCADECHDDPFQNDGQRNYTVRNALLKGHTWMSWRPGGDADTRPPKSGNIATFEYCLVHMNRRRYTTEEPDLSPLPKDWPFLGSKRSGRYISPTQRNNTIITDGRGLGWAHKWPIKTYSTGDAGGLYCRLNMSNCIIRIDTPPVEGYSNPGRFPNLATGTVHSSSYNNVHICWVGPPAGGTGYGPWPFEQSKSQLADMGITLHDDENEAFDLWTFAEELWRTANGYNELLDNFSWNRIP